MKIKNMGEKYVPIQSEMKKALNHLTEIPDSAIEDIKDDDSDAEVKRKSEALDKWSDENWHIRILKEASEYREYALKNREALEKEGFVVDLYYSRDFEGFHGTVGEINGSKVLIDENEKKCFIDQKEVSEDIYNGMLARFAKAAMTQITALPPREMQISIMEYELGIKEQRLRLWKNSCEMASKFGVYCSPFYNLVDKDGVPDEESTIQKQESYLKKLKDALEAFKNDEEMENFPVVDR